MNRIRVCTVNPDFYRSSGVTHAIERLQKSSKNLPIDWINVTCTKPDKKASNDYLEIAAVFRLMDTSFRLVFDIFRFRAFLKNQKIDVLHVHHRRLALVAGCIARSLDIPVVYTGHLVYGGGVLLKLAPIDSAIAITNDVLNDFKTYGRAKSTFLISNQAKFFNAPVPLPRSGCVTICCIGRLEPVKNHTTLLNAWAQSNAKTYSKLVLVGEGSLRQELEKTAENLGIGASVVFAGFSADVDAFIMDSHFLILPSLVEGQPMVILEAAGFYRPTLISDAPGARDCLPPNLALPNKIAVDDVAGFSEALDTWSANLGLVEQDGYIFNNYLKNIASPEVVSGKTYDVYRHVLGIK